MPLDLTLLLLAPALAVAGLALWQVRRKREPGDFSLLDWHYVLFPAFVVAALLALHLAMLLTAR